MMSNETSSSRRAALALHALDPQDRLWVLERLEPLQRAHVEALLGELTELGIPADPALLRQALADAPARVTSSRERLDAMPARRIANALRDEPPGLVSRVLAAHPWRWTNEFLAALDKDQRRFIADAARAVDPDADACEFDRWLLDELLHRVAAEEAPA